jgi:hypothetical protein
MSNELRRSRESSLFPSDERFSHPGLVYRHADPIQRPPAPAPTTRFGSRLERGAEAAEANELAIPDTHVDARFLQSPRPDGRFRRVLAAESDTRWQHQLSEVMSRLNRPDDPTAHEQRQGAWRAAFRGGTSDLHSRLRQWEGRLAPSIIYERDRADQIIETYLSRIDEGQRVTAHNKKEMGDNMSSYFYLHDRDLPPDKRADYQAKWDALSVDRKKEVIYTIIYTEDKLRRNH